MKICLVVDDSSVIRKVARRILEGLEFQIVEAEDGEQALGVCQRQLPDAVLLDWNMPKMDGYETARKIRAMPEGREVKLVALTGWGQGQIRERAHDAGRQDRDARRAGEPESDHGVERGRTRAGQHQTRAGDEDGLAHRITRL